MSKMGDFVAFRAMIHLVKEQGKDFMLGEIYEQCRSANDGQENLSRNCTSCLRQKRSPKKIADIVRPEDMKADLQIVFQTIEIYTRLYPCIRATGISPENYPTQGGMKVANQSYLNYMDGKLVRAY